jgi:hypothetical protein
MCEFLAALRQCLRLAGGGLSGNKSRESSDMGPHLCNVFWHLND